MAAKRKKKLVRVESDPTSPASEPTWKPTPEAKAKANRNRIIAVLLWLVAIGIEVGTIFWVLKQDEINMALLIGAIVLIGVLSIIGSLLWKKANQADPARRSDPVRFFLKNQLGAILAVVAFLPLIVMIIKNANLEGNQKKIATGIAAVAAIVAALFGTSFNSPSVEQYTEETARVIELTGDDIVYWTKSGEVYHLCADVSAVNLESEDNTIYSGTVGEAHAAGKERLTLQVDMELEQCGFDPIDEAEE